MHTHARTPFARHAPDESVMVAVRSFDILVSSTFALLLGMHEAFRRRLCVLR
jgi:hypothetical protein